MNTATKNTSTSKRNGTGCKPSNRLPVTPDVQQVTVEQLAIKAASESMATSGSWGNMTPEVAMAKSYKLFLSAYGVAASPEQKSAWELWQARHSVKLTDGMALLEVSSKLAKPDDNGLATVEVKTFKGQRVLTLAERRTIAERLSGRLAAWLADPANAVK